MSSIIESLTKALSEAQKENDDKQLREEIKAILNSDETNEKTVSEEIENSIYKLAEEEINNMDISEEEKEKKLKKLDKLRKQRVNIMLIGSTGSGKSSTVNALFDMNIAKVGEGVDPETKSIKEFQLDNLTIWDTPGLGDSVEKDEVIFDEILLKLQEKDDKNYIVE